ncbi:MAG: hypothetical protein FWD11_07955, partial [Micrococcales bacterium]|nr:hypothetical protein [Micrococcales bacterium]
MGMREGAAVPTPPRLPELILGRDQGRVAQGIWVGRGAYLPPGDWTETQVALARIAAVHRQMGA